MSYSKKRGIVILIIIIVVFVSQYSLAIPCYSDFDASYQCTDDEDCVNGQCVTKQTGDTDTGGTGGTDTTTSPPPFNPSTDQITNPSSQVSNNVPVIFNNPNWQNYYSQYVSSEDIAQIPPDKIEVLSVIDVSKLTIAQIQYSGNIQSLITSGRVSQLSDTTLNQYINKITTQPISSQNLTLLLDILSELYQQNIYLQLDDNTQITITNGLININNANLLQLGNYFINDGVNVQIGINSISMDSAGTLIINGNEIITNLEGLEIDADEFSLTSAETIRFPCKDNFEYILMQDVQNSTFKVYDFVRITAGSDISYQIEDCSGNTVNFSSEKDGQLTLTKFESIPTYILNNSQIKVNNETLKTNTTTFAKIDPYNGYVCMTLGIGSELRDDTNKYLIIVPMDGDEYKLCLRKKQEQNFNYLLQDSCIQCGLLDFIDKNNTLKGRIIFKRYVNDYWLNLFDIYNGVNSFRGINVINNHILAKQNELYSYTSPTNFYIIKEENNNRSLSKYALILDKKTDSLIEYYESEINMPIHIKDNIINQTNNNKQLLIYPKNHFLLDEFLFDKVSKDISARIMANDNNIIYSLQKGNVVFNFGERVI